MGKQRNVPVLAILIIAFIGTASTTIASPVYRYINTPVPDASAKPGSPLIRRVALNKHHYSSHDQIRMQVTTTRDVVKVTNHELGHGGLLRKVSPGVFFGRGRVSGIPFFLKGMHVDMHYTATTASGATTTVSVPVTF
jgi:hypothetical protein